MQEHEITAQTHHSLVSPRSQKGDFPPAELTFAQVLEILYDGTKPPGDPWGEEGTEDRDVICDVDAAVDVSIWSILHVLSAVPKGTRDSCHTEGPPAKSEGPYPILGLGDVELGL